MGVGQNRYKLLFLIVALFYSCESKMNITVNNDKLKIILKQFTEKAYTQTGSYPEFISVMVENNRDKPVWGLYDSKFLEPKYYLGVTRMDDVKIHFYSNDGTALGEFIEIDMKRVVQPNFDDRNHVYVRYYTFDNGQFYLHRVKGS